MSTYIKPVILDFKTNFARDFLYGTDPNVAILDADITKAFLYVDAFFNEGLASDQASYTLYYLLLAAHFLVQNIRTSSQGLASQGALLASSKGAGSVSVGQVIPQVIQDSPMLSQLMTTGYGAEFIEFITPQLSGVCFSVHGKTLP